MLIPLLYKLKAVVPVPPTVIPSKRVPGGVALFPSIPPFKPKRKVRDEDLEIVKVLTEWLDRI